MKFGIKKLETSIARTALKEFQYIDRFGVGGVARQCDGQTDRRTDVRPDGQTEVDTR